MNHQGILKRGREDDGGTRQPLSDRSIATIVGVLFIVGTVAGALSALITAPIFGSNDVLAQVAAHQPQMVLASLLVLTMAFGLAMVPVVFYPVAKRYSQVLAMGYVVFRGAIEAIVCIATPLAWLLLIALSKESAAAAAPVGGSVLATLGVLSSQFAPIPFVIGALMFSWVLYISRLVPRWLSVWGLIGAVLYLVPALTAMLGLSSGILMLPLALQEMVLAVWLIAKGFSPTAEVPATDDGASAPHVALSTGRS
jgi:hypothetical protein